MNQQLKICFKSIVAVGCLSPYQGRKHTKKFQKKEYQKYYFSDVGKMVVHQVFEGYDWGLHPYIPL